MFKKENRLPKGQNFKNSRILSTPFFNVRIAQNNSLINRYGFIVSKKIDKRAVIRNKTKRRLRAQIEKIKNQIKNGYDFLFVAKKRLIKEENKELFKEISKILNEKGIIK